MIDKDMLFVDIQGTEQDAFIIKSAEKKSVAPEENLEKPTEKEKTTCPQCGSTNVTRTQGSNECRDCGFAIDKKSITKSKKELTDEEIKEEENLEKPTEKSKYYEGDKCPKCNEGTLEFVDMKGEEMLQCDSCDFTYSEKSAEVAMTKSKQEYCEMCEKPIQLSNPHYPCCSQKCEDAANEHDANLKQCPFCTQKSLEEISQTGAPTILQCSSCGQICTKEKTTDQEEDSWQKPKRKKKTEEKGKW